jgi:outer membrane protein assembly factor BamD (BamD/ComL family)
MALPLAGLAALTLAVDVAEAQTAGGWRKEVAEKYQAAEAAAKKGSFTEAIRLLKEAKAKAPLSPQEEHGINEYLIYAASSAKDHKLVLQTVDERLATGRVTGADLARKLRLKATTHYSLRDYRNAAAAFSTSSVSTSPPIPFTPCPRTSSPPSSSSRSPSASRSWRSRTVTRCSPISRSSRRRSPG